MNESAVMPMATMAPQTAGRFSAKPMVGPSSAVDHRLQVKDADTSSEAIAMNDRPR
ncbi:hypothetical protein SHIRM173S_08222 [Streptomyces hirsutus]